MCRLYEVVAELKSEHEDAYTTDAYRYTFYTTDAARLSIVVCARSALYVSRGSRPLS